MESWMTFGVTDEIVVMTKYWSHIDSACATPWSYIEAIGQNKKVVPVHNDSELMDE